MNDEKESFERIYALGDKILDLLNEENLCAAEEIAACTMAYGACLAAGAPDDDFIDQTLKEVKNVTLRVYAARKDKKND